MSEYKRFPMIFIAYEDGMRLEKGWWARSAVGTVMYIHYGDKNKEETDKKDKDEITVVGDKVLMSCIATFRFKDHAKLLKEAIHEKDYKEALDSFSDPKSGNWVSLDKTWTIIRPHKKGEKLCIYKNT